MSETLTIRRPDDWHLHLRDGAALKSVLPFTAQQFGRAIVMPNLTPPITTAAAAQTYRARITAALPAGSTFEPLMVAYLTDGTDPDALAAGFADRSYVAAKLYPAHATTNSSAGVTNIRNIESVLERMAEIGMPLLVHGEVTDPTVDIFDRLSTAFWSLWSTDCRRCASFSNMRRRNAPSFSSVSPAPISAPRLHHITFC